MGWIVDMPPLFEGRYLEVTDKRRDYGEERIICTGEISSRIFVVVYTRRGGRRRIISARDANAKEKQLYYRSRR